MTLKTDTEKAVSGLVNMCGIILTENIPNSCRFTKALASLSMEKHCPSAMMTERTRQGKDYCGI